VTSRIVRWCGITMLFMLAGATGASIVLLYVLIKIWKFYL